MAEVPYRDSPSVAPETQVPNDYQHVEANPAEFGGLIAQGGEKLGAGATKASEFFGQIRSDAALINAIDPSNKALENFQSLHGQDAAHAEQPTIDAINDAFKTARASLDTPDEQLAFDKQAIYYRERYLAGQVKSHADRERDVYSNAVNDALIQNGRAIVVAHPDDDAALQTGIGLMHQGAIKKLQLRGLADNPDIVTATQNETNRNFTEARIQALLPTNPARAKAVFDANQSSLASGSNYDQLSRAVETYSDRADGATAARQQWNGGAIPGGAPNPNNLGNVKTPNGARLGTQDYMQPATAADGVTLAVNNLRSNYRGMTLAQIGAKWEGTSPDKIAAWIKNASTASGIASNAVPNLDNPTQLRSLLTGIGTAEKSVADQARFTPVIIDQGIQAALSGKAPALGQPAASTPVTASTASAPAVLAPPAIDHMISNIEGERTSGKLSDGAADHAISIVTRDWHHWQQVTAQDRAQFDQSIKDGAAMLEAGRDWSPDIDRMRRRLPQDQIDSVMHGLAEAKEAGQAMNAARWMSPAELTTKFTQLQASLNDPTDFAQKERVSNAFLAAVQRRNQSLADDPAAYVNNAPPVQRAWQTIDSKTGAGTERAIAASLAEQERLGVPEEYRSALTKDQASMIAHKFMTTDPAQADIGAVLARAEQTYGIYWPRVMGDLRKAGLPSDFMILGAMDTPAQTGARADMQRMLQFTSPKGGAKQLDKLTDPEAKKEIDQSLDTTLSSFRDTTRFNGSEGATLYTEVHDSVRDLAYWYSYQGQTASRAIQSAYDGVIGAKYDFDGTMRVPAGQLDAVHDATRSIIEGLKPADFGNIPGNPNLTPEQRAGIYSNALRNGAWVNNQDDTGLVLMVRLQNNQMITARRADGNRIELKFADLQKLNARRPTAPTGAPLDMPFQTGPIQ
jgi:hypothetical protein